MSAREPSSSLDKPSLDTLPAPDPDQPQYRLYKARFAGLFGFVVLGFVTGMPWAWFGPISNEAADEFGISVNQVNWLGNILSCVYVPVSLLVPVFTSRFGILRSAQVGALLTLVAGWIRYAGTASALDPDPAYALLIIGQLFSAIAQPIFQVLGPMYSEKWFDLRGRTTATMVIAISNPIGSAIGQLLAPLVGTAHLSIFVLAIISTAATPAVLFISSAPPTPPTYAGSKPPPTLLSLCRAVLGRPVSQDAYMTYHERLDFVIITLLFGVLVGATNALSVLSAEWFEPMGYSDTTSGLLSASVLLSGIVASAVSAPLFDRIFTHRLGLALKIMTPVVAAGWFSLIWAVRPNNTVALFCILVVIGICSMTMLPVGLELGVELTRNADASAALLWCSGNLFGLILILAEGALRAPATAKPPFNMTKALILHGTIVLVSAVAIFFVQAKQARRTMDESMAAEQAIPMSSEPSSLAEVTTEETRSVKDTS